jgi:heat shock protein HtpX
VASAVVVAQTPDTGAASVRRAAILVAGAGVVPALVVGLVLAFVVAPLVGVVVFVVAAVVVAAFVWHRATASVLKRIGGRVVNPEEVPRLANVVEGLCATFGLRMPALVVLEDPVPNTCSVGRDPTTASVMVTRGLLDQLDLIELEGVMAHELAHIKERDTVLGDVAVTVLWPLVAVLGSDALIRWALGSGREFRADQMAVSLVRYPTGLRDALDQMVAAPVPAGSYFTGRGWRATRRLWCVPSVGGARERAIGDLDDPVVRRDALSEY